MSAPGRLSKHDVRSWMIEDLERAKRGFTRKDVMDEFKVTYYMATAALEALVRQGLAAKVKEAIRGPIYRWIYYPLFFRTQYAKIFYAPNPTRGSKGQTTPDPIAEFRVTVVMPHKGAADKLIENGEKILTHLGMILAPWINWRNLVGPRGGEMAAYTAYELDEPIMPDEVELSIPDYKKFGYAERYACFFRGHREYWRWLRNIKPELRPFLESRPEELPPEYQTRLDEFFKAVREEETGMTAMPNEYYHWEYGEREIKVREDMRIRGVLYDKYPLRTRFNNETWELEPVGRVA